MSATKTCRACNAPVPNDAPFGHCPGCLAELGFGPLNNVPPYDVPEASSDYELLEILGRGGMGVVYKARQRSLNRLVALKMLNPQSAAFPRVAERLRIEAEAAASLHHPGIVTIHEVGERDGYPFFSMELVEGVGLDQLIKRGGYHSPHREAIAHDSVRDSQCDCVRTMIAIARAVDYAHRHGVLHRDLKPANVIIDLSGEPHLTDFGLAKILGRQRVRETDSGSVLGTPAYMAPEQAAGETKHVSTAADIYSLGAVFYEMLTGRPPFRADTPLETLRQVTEEEPEHPNTLNAKVDADLSTISLKCLEKNPDRRYATAQSLAEDLERWLRHEPIAARPVGRVARAWRWCRREPRLAGLAAGLLVLLLSTTLLALNLYRQEKDRLRIEKQEHDRERSALLNRIAKDWDQADRIGVKIYAQELALLGERKHNIEGGERSIVLGVAPPRRGSNPIQIVQRFTPLVNFLETNLPALVFELHLYTSYSNALVGLRKGEIQLMLLSPASYVALRKEQPSILPLARESIRGQARLRVAVFSRAESPLRQLDELKGNRLAFSFTGFPVVEDWVKAELWSAGLRASQLACVTNLPRNLVMAAVNANRFDAGVADLNELAWYVQGPHPKFRLLREVTAPGFLWVGSTNLLSSAASAIRDRMISIRDSEILAAINEELTGFEVTEPADFDGVEQILERARLFDDAGDVRAGTLKE